MEALIQRVRGEFREMPGLRLTFAQACRLWQMDPTTCRIVLERLTRDGVLLQTRHGHYVAAPRPSQLDAAFDRPKRAAS
jgi:DNA-binding GntR family transcriptional regulator